MPHVKINNDKSITNLLLIPGGPGLSSNTLRIFDVLADNFNLHYWDTQGTNGSSFDPSIDIGDIINGITEKTSHLKNLIVLGHSFGGLIATQLVNLPNVIGIVCMATPLSEEAFIKVGENYQKNITDDLQRKLKEWEHNPSEHSFKNWLASYGKLFFKKKSDKDIILNDQVSYKYFLKSRDNKFDFKKIKFDLMASAKKKLYFLGSEDLLIDESQAKIDARESGFEYFILEDEAHFLSKGACVELGKTLKYKFPHSDYFF